MTLSLHLEEGLRPSDYFWFLILLALLPAVMAAGILEKSPRDSSLPEPDAYKSPLSETLMESNKWRVPPAEEPRDWRLPPPPPPLEWRTEPSPDTDKSRASRSFELFPRYKPGSQFSYDYIGREDKPQIKVFEFGSD